MRSFVAQELRQRMSVDPQLAVRSLVPIFPTAKLVDFFALAVDKEKAKRIVDLLTWDPTSGRVFDVQYQPIVKAGDNSLVPFNVFAASNILRNTLYLHGKHPVADPGRDVLAENLEAAIATRTAQVRRSFEYTIAGMRGELDVIALIDGVVFVFECKNPHSPCSPHELRTSLDHLRSAAKQLNRVRALSEQLSFRGYLGKQLGWSIPPQSPLVTCIVTGNRVLSGYRIEGHSVRSVFELSGFIEEGDALVANRIVRLRESGPVTARDLQLYLDDDLVHQRFFDAMESSTREYDIGPEKVVFRTFALDIVALARAFGVEPSDDDFVPFDNFVGQSHFPKRN